MRFATGGVLRRASRVAQHQTTHSFLDRLRENVVSAVVQIVVLLAIFANCRDV